MLLWLLLLFTVTPLVELALLLWVSDHTDWKFTLALVLGTGIVGAWLARRQGWQVWRRIQEELRQGKLPAESLQDALLIFLAGVLLITPGLLTDAVGFSLLLPPLRRLVRRYLARRITARFTVRTYGFPPGRPDDRPSDPNVIDVPFTRLEQDKKPDPKPPS